MIRSCWRNFTFVRVLLILSLILPNLACAETRALRIGLIPLLSTRILIANYQPLRTYLERELKQPVELVTATDFRTFHLNTIAGDYDVIVTAPHFARLAQIESKYIPLAAYRSVNRAILITAKDRPLRSVNELRGQSLAIFDRHAMIVVQTMQWLREQGINSETDFKILETPNMNSAATSVINHESVLAVVGTTAMKQMPDSIKRNIQVYENLPELPTSLIWMAHPNITVLAPQIKSVLLKFTSEIQEGALFFEATGYIGLRDINNDEMRKIDPYAKELKRAFK